MTYHCIQIDPPWPEKGGGGRGADKHYDVIDHRADIVRAIVTSPSWRPADDCHLWCWTTMMSLLDGLCARVAAQVEFIRHWRVIHGDYTEAPDIEATWLIDGPYQGEAGEHYRHGSRDIDYAHLARWSPRRGQVVVCEALGADWLPFVQHSAPQRSAMNRRPSLVEAIWTTEMEAA